MNLYVVYETTNFLDVNSHPALTNALFGAVKLNKNADIDKYKFFGYGIGLDGDGFYSHPSGGTVRNVIIFGADMSSSVHADNKGKDILILGKGPTQGLGEHSLTAEKMYSINFAKINTEFYFCLYYNGANSCLFVYGTEIRRFTAKDSEILPNNLCLGNIWKIFQQVTWKKTGFNGHIYDFSVDYDVIDVDDFLDIHKYLMKKNDIV